MKIEKRMKPGREIIQNKLDETIAELEAIKRAEKHVETAAQSDALGVIERMLGESKTLLELTLKGELYRKDKEQNDPVRVTEDGIEIDTDIFLEILNKLLGEKDA